MKHVSILFLSLCMGLGVQAQIATPAASPAATLTQEVGLTTISVDYSRPSMRGRKIFGGILPYDMIWRTGANATTKFTTDKPLMIKGQELKAGTYSLYTVPEETAWDIVFYTDDSNPLISEFDGSKIALRTNVEAQQLPMDIQSFTITIDDVTAESAVLGMMWENVYVGVPFEVGTDKEVMASIDSALSGPTAGDYYNAAVYYLNADKDINKSKMYMDKAMGMTKEPKFWQLRQQSLILAKAGDKKAAVTAAQASLAGAKEAKNEDYIRMNMASLKEWGAM